MWVGLGQKERRLRVRTLCDRMTDFLFHGRDVPADLVLFVRIVFNGDLRHDMRRHPSDLLMAKPENRHDLVPLPFDAGRRRSHLVAQAGDVQDFDRLRDLLADMRIAPQGKNPKFDQHDRSSALSRRDVRSRMVSDKYVLSRIDSTFSVSFASLQTDESSMNSCSSWVEHRSLACSYTDLTGQGTMLSQQDHPPSPNARA